MPTRRQIFICYRQADAAAHAGRLFDSLSKDFGRKQVFFDRGGSIAAGENWKIAIDEQIAASAVLVVLIGKNWQPERLATPDDVVHREISRALALGVRVIPVLLNDATLPRAPELPEEIRPLLDRQVLEMTERHWTSDYEQLEQTIRSELRRRRGRLRPAAAVFVAVLVLVSSAYIVTKKPWTQASTTTTSVTTATTGTTATTETSTPAVIAVDSTPIRPDAQRGIDLRSPALDQLPAGTSFGFIIATPDNRFRELWKKAHDRGLIRGATYIFSPTADPEWQARDFATTVRPGRDDLLGVSVSQAIGSASPAEHSRNLRRFLDRVEELTGKRCVIYVRNETLWNDNYDSSFGDYPLMFTGRPPAPLPRGWSRVAIWVGMSEKAFFVFNGTKDELLALARTGT